MSEHEKWFKSLNENGKTVYFLSNEHKVSKMAWDFQQAEINQLQLQINEMAVVGLSQESELNKKDERAHNLYYENANLQMLIEEKNKRIEELVQKYSCHTDPFNNDVNECIKEFIEDLKALRGES